MTKRVVIIGAGAVGRGFLGEIFHDAGWLLRFVDADPEVVARLRLDGSYLHTTVGSALQTRQIPCEDAACTTETDLVRRWVGEADCIVTSVGPSALPAVAEMLSPALLARSGSGSSPIDVLLCENLHDASNHFRACLERGLADVDRAALQHGVGLVETSIGRMIPPPGTLGEERGVAAEPYRFLPIDGRALRAPLPDVPDLVVDERPFAFWGDRKLYVHNLGHFTCALLGAAEGVSSIAESISLPWVRYFTRAVMLEAAAAVASRHDVVASSLITHIDDLLARFGNAALGDTCARVARDPFRKLAPDDRVQGALRCAVEQHTSNVYLTLALALGARALAPGKDQECLDEACASLSTAAAKLARAQFAALASGFDPIEQMALIDEAFATPRIP